MTKENSSATYDQKNRKIISLIQKLSQKIEKCRDAGKLKQLKKEKNDAETELLELNGGLILKLCRKYTVSTEFEDALQHAKLELLKAAKLYNTAGKTKFTSYAAKYIFTDVVRRETYFNKLNKFNHRLNLVLKEFQDEGNFNPTNAEIAERLKMPGHEFASLYLNLNQLSIDDKFNEHKRTDTSLQIADIVEDKSVDIIQDYIDREKREIIFRAIKVKLNYREAKYVYEYFFLGKSQTEIGKEENLSRERVSQIIKIAVVKLKPYLTRHLNSNITGEKFQL